MKWRERLSRMNVRYIGEEILDRYTNGQKKYQGYHGNPIYHAREELHDAEIHLLMAERRDLYARNLLTDAAIILEKYHHKFGDTNTEQLLIPIQEFLSDAITHPGFTEESKLNIDKES